MCVGRCNRLFYVHTVVKREMILLPLLYERERSGLEREVWPGKEVTRRGRSLWSLSRLERGLVKETKEKGVLSLKGRVAERSEKRKGNERSAVCEERSQRSVANR